jgi:hypothetical protein
MQAWPPQRGLPRNLRSAFAECGCVARSPYAWPYSHCVEPSYVAPCVVCPPVSCPGRTRRSTERVVSAAYEAYEAYE